MIISLSKPIVSDISRDRIGNVTFEVTLLKDDGITVVETRSFTLSIQRNQSGAKNWLVDEFKKLIAEFKAEITIRQQIETNIATLKADLEVALVGV